MPSIAQRLSPTDAASKKSSREGLPLPLDVDVLADHVEAGLLRIVGATEAHPAVRAGTRLHAAGAGRRGVSPCLDLREVLRHRVTLVGVAELEQRPRSQLVACQPSRSVHAPVASMRYPSRPTTKKRSPVSRKSCSAWALRMLIVLTDVCSERACEAARWSADEVELQAEQESVLSVASCALRDHDRRHPRSPDVELEGRRRSPETTDPGCPWGRLEHQSLVGRSVPST